MVLQIKGRPRKYAEFDAFYSSLPKTMTKRPRYFKGVGIFRGARHDTAWVKINLPNGGSYEGRAYAPGQAVEIKVGRFTSWSWEKLVAKHTELQGKADRNEPLSEEITPTFEVWADDWLKRAKQRVRHYGTVEIHVRVHLKPTFGAKLVNKITVSDVNGWISSRLANAAPGTVKRQFITLRAILNDAKRAGKLDINPCANAQPIRSPAGRQRFLSGPEIVQLLAAAAADSEWLSDFILWSIHSGMRRSELLNMQWSHVCPIGSERTVILVPHTKSDQPRMVACTETMLAVLGRQQGRKRNSDPTRVFPVALITLKRHWQKVRKTAGLSDVTLHDLRRTHATHAAASGVDLRTLADRLGHADLSMLQRHYAAIVGSAATDAADTFQRVYDNLTKEKKAA